MKINVEISNLNQDPPAVYTATCEDDCKDSTDLSAYREAVKLNDVVTMGKVIACPVPTTDRSKLLDELGYDKSSPIHHARFPLPKT